MTTEHDYKQIETELTDLLKQRCEVSPKELSKINLMIEQRRAALSKVNNVLYVDFKKKS